MKTWDDGYRECHPVLTPALQRIYGCAGANLYPPAELTASERDRLEDVVHELSCHLAIIKRELDIE